MVLVLLAVLVSSLPATIDRNLVQPSSSSVRHRRSGYSDQRLAELETIFALSEMNQRHRVSVPQVGFGVVDVRRIGKRKRSFDESASADSELSQVSEIGSVLLDRVLRRLRRLSPTASSIESDEEGHRNPRLLSNR